MRLSSWRGALAALLIVIPAHTVRAQGLAVFDVSRSTTWGQALALCDMTSFLQGRPSLDADVIMASDGRSDWPRPLYAPAFLPPGLFFDPGVRSAFERLERAGETNRREFSEARARHDQRLFRTYRHAAGTERQFLKEQSELCRALVADVRSRYR